MSILALLIVSPAFATDPDPVAQKTVASKAYVDTKQDIIETGNVMFWDDPEGTEGDIYVPGLVAYDPQTSALSGNKIGILDQETIADDEGSLDAYNDGNGNYENGEMDNYVPTVRAVAEALQLLWNSMPDSWTALTWDSAETTSTNAYETKFVGDTGATANAWPSADRTKLVNTAALAQGLALKQNKITTGLVDYYSVADEETSQLPSLVSYDSTSGLVGNKIGILDYYNANNDGWSSLTGAEMDNFVPTVRAVANSIQRLNWNPSTHPNAINAYSTSFTGTTNNWPSDNMTKLVTGNTFAQGLALKQNKLSAKSSNARAQAVTRSTAGNTTSAYITAGGSVGLTTRSGAPAIIGYVNGTAVTDSTAMTTFTTGTFGSNSATNQDYIKNALVSLELLKDVYSALHTEIQNSAPTGTANTLANYDSTGALGTGVATYDGSTTYDSTNDASKVAIMSAVQRKKECGGYETGHENDPDYCWLWILPD